MDADRKSTVSSFYHGRQASNGDALTGDFPRMSGSASRQRQNRDDVSSFYHPERNSIDRLNDSRPIMSAGYNKNSFFNSGREEPLKGGKDEEEEAWDVYADFNNAGPRYSSAFTPQTFANSSHSGYHQLPTPPTPQPHEQFDANGAKVEMVTVPAMGAEWSKDELKNMTKRGRKERKAEARKEFWTAWRRDQRGLCGKYFTRRVLVFFLFGLCAAIGIVLAFTIPRVPKFSFQSSTPLANATGEWAEAVPYGFSRAPANFSFPAYAALTLDTTSSYLPLHFTSLKAEVFDLDTDRQVGTGDLGKRTIPARGFPRILLPLNMTYAISNDSDVTWNNWYNACKNRAIYPDGKRTSLKFKMLLDMTITGLPGHKKASVQISDAECPWELPINAA
ncbi:hypothetical protein NMY22_g1290 [Coprinellus aureogranulatus]|nr:hypothetical protein NMY22_g1290 [Coprinellus aureogranulatus]